MTILLSVGERNDAERAQGWDELGQSSGIWGDAARETKFSFAWCFYVRKYWFGLGFFLQIGTAVDLCTMGFPHQVPLTSLSEPKGDEAGLWDEKVSGTKSISSLYSCLFLGVLITRMLSGTHLVTNKILGMMRVMNSIFPFSHSHYSPPKDLAGRREPNTIRKLKISMGSAGRLEWFNVLCDEK